MRAPRRACKKGSVLVWPAYASVPRVAGEAPDCSELVCDANESKGHQSQTQPGEVEHVPSSSQIFRLRKLCKIVDFRARPEFWRGTGAKNGGGHASAGHVKDRFGCFRLSIEHLNSFGSR